MENTKEIILPTDDRTITKVETRQVWTAANGKFYLSEESARLNGATHVLCKCGQPKEKYRIHCDSCEPKIQDDEYAKMPFKEWDGETPLCIFKSDQYFFDEETIREYA